MKDTEQSRLAAAVVALGDEHAIRHPAVGQTHHLFLAMARALDTALACTVENADVHRTIQHIEHEGLLYAEWQQHETFAPTRREIAVATEAMRRIDPECDETDAKHMLTVLGRLGTRYLEPARRSA